MSNPAAKVGGGLVEISAVATIIGAPIAEVLIHGLKGACGMVWAPMSTFGAIHVTKACLAAAIPDYLRDATGLRNPHVDAALGVALPINPSRRTKNRVDLGDACAIRSSERADGQGSTVLPSSEQSSTPLNSIRNEISALWSRRARCIYTLDKNSHLVLDTVYASVTERGEAVKVHRFEPDLAGALPAWKDWLVLLASLVKLLESFALWRLQARWLWLYTSLGWMHAFVSAVILQLCGLGRDNIRQPPDDIVAGRLPSPLHLGGNGKVVLQAPANVRRHLLWRVLLAIGVLFNAAGLFGTFLDLGSERQRVIYTWVGFQILWLCSRTVIFYFVEGAAGARQGVILSMSWDETSDDDRQRVLRLLGDLSKQQVSIHPRGVIAYQNDCLNFHELSNHLERLDWNLTSRLNVADSENKVWKINIKAVAGDPVIRSAVWFTGSKLDNSELYDATVAFVSLDQHMVAVPCVRVWACDCLTNEDQARGNAHPDCGMIKWLYFIPFGKNSDQGWIMAHGLSATGLLMTEVLSNEELDRRFRQRRYRISMQSLDDLNRALEVARSGVTITRDLTKSAADSHRTFSSSTFGKSSKTTIAEVHSPSVDSIPSAR